MTYYRRGRSRTPEVYEGYGVEGVYKPLPSITSKEAIQVHLFYFSGQGKNIIFRTFIVCRKSENL